jgi:hypothetical protein
MHTGLLLKTIVFYIMKGMTYYHTGKGGLLEKTLDEKIRIIIRLYSGHKAVDLFF